MKGINMFFSIKKDIYDKKVLLKTCYKFTDEYYIHLDSNKDEFVISIQKKDGKADTSIEGEFKNELIEFASWPMTPLIRGSPIKPLFEYIRAIFSTGILFFCRL